MSEIQNKMFLEIRDKNIFNQAQEFSLEYLENFLPKCLPNIRSSQKLVDI